MLDAIREAGVHLDAAEMEIGLARMPHRPAADAVVEVEQAGLVGHLRARLGRHEAARRRGRDRRLLVIALYGLAAALFSAAIASMYAVMIYAYPCACRSAGIGFGIFVARIGAIAGSGLGGTLIDMGEGSLLPYFGTLIAVSALVFAAPLIVDRHVPPARARS